MTYTLKVEVIEAKSLENKDLVGKSDPYVVVGLKGDNNQVFKTQVVSNDLNPVWKETFQFTLQNPSSAEICFSVKDKDLFWDDSLGFATVKLAGLYLQQNVPVDRWLRLEEGGYGRIHVKFTATNFSLPQLITTGQTGKVPDNADVYVIGGGFAGVQLAESLRSKGVNVILLEAQDTLGGRTKKCIIDVDGKKVPYDIGGEYLGIDQNALFQYVTNVYKTQLDSLLIDTYEMTNFMDGKQINPLAVEVFNETNYTYPMNNWTGIQGIPTQWVTGEGIITHLLPLGLGLARILTIQGLVDINDPLGTLGKMTNERVKKIMQDLDKSSLEDWLKGETYLPTDISQVIRISMEAPMSQTISAMNALYWWWYNKGNGGYIQVINDVQYGPQQYFLQCTFHELINLIAQDLFKEKRIYFNKVVKKIEATKDSGKAKITLADGTVLNGKYAVVAMSPNTAGKIEYTEGTISEARKLFMSQSMGRTAKAFLVYKKPWWRNYEHPEKSYSGYVGCLMNASDYTKDNINIMWCMDNSLEFPIGGLPPLYTIMCFFTNDDVDKLVKQANESGDPDKFVKKVCVDHVAYFFRDPDTKKEKQTEAEQVIGFSWGVWDKNTQHIYGGPDTNVRPGDFGKILPCIRAKESGNLFFAAAEYAQYWGGYVTGAIGNGIETANQILPLLNKEPIKYTVTNSPTNPLTKRGRDAKQLMDSTPGLTDLLKYDIILAATKVEPIIEFAIDVVYKIIKKIIEIIKNFLGRKLSDIVGGKDTSQTSKQFIRFYAHSSIDLIVELQQAISIISGKSLITTLRSLERFFRRNDPGVAKMLAELSNVTKESIKKWA